MESSAFNANVQFENYYAYTNNMSGFTTEQSETRPTMIHGKNFNSSYSGIEYLGGDGDDELQDIEIIAIDPNSFYATSDEDEDEDDDDDDNVSVTAMEVSDGHVQYGNIQLGIDTMETNLPLYPAMAFDVQPTSSDDYDIITFNINDDEFQIDADEDDNILFQNGHQFDLANYIGGCGDSECSALLLSPVNDVATATAAPLASSSLNMRHHIQLPLLSHTNAEPMKTVNSTRVPINTAAHVKVAKTPASNRRKRKNLSREFILESDDDSSDADSNNKFTAVITNKINQISDDRKLHGQRKPVKEIDPIWNPTTEKRHTIAAKSSIGQVKFANGRNESTKVHKNTRTKPLVKQTGGQGKNLRSVLKQHLLSDRPINKSKFIKTTPCSSFSSKVMQNTVENCNVTNVAQAPVHRMGVGRGKDIAITAKYYNRTGSSDDDDDNDENISVQEKSHKIYQYHQVYTDSEDSDMEIDVSGDPLPEPSLQPKPEPEIYTQEKEMAIANCTVDETCKRELNGKLAGNRENSRAENVDRARVKKGVKVPVEKSKRNKTKLKSSNKPILSSESLDTTEFAKALVVNVKAKTKAKSTASASASSSSLSSSSITATKRTDFEKQQRLIKSNLLLQNPAKFEQLTADKPKTISAALPVASSGKRPVINTIYETETKLNGVTTNSFKEVKESPRPPTEMKPISCTQIKVETENTAEVENQNIDVKKEIKPDVTELTDHKIESNAKRKLNIQEYLRRKNLKATAQNDCNGRKGDLIVNSIKNEKRDAMDNSINPNDKSNNGGDAEVGPDTGCLAGNSMYEEIIIVSMGCNTDISIPETPLLTDIQTSVVKAITKISCSSLISSILEQTAKTHTKTIDPRKIKSNGTENTDDGAHSVEIEEHGENKVIMHLRKDRVRPMRMSTSIQTDPYFQFPPLQKLVPASRKQSTLVEKSTKRMNSGGSESQSISHTNHHFVHSKGGSSGGVTYNKNYGHRNSRGRSHFSESSYYSDEEVKTNKNTQRPSRHSQFVEHHKLRQQQQQQQQQQQRHKRHHHHRRESSRYSTSKYDRYESRNRTISRSLSSSSDNSSVSVSSSSTPLSVSSRSSIHISRGSSPSLNSYSGSSSSKSYSVCDDHQYYRKRKISSSNSRRNTHRHHSTVSKHRSSSPEERRIVYVGRLEDEITKDKLCHKFSVYGQVKHVSIHCKETKMKYGFITYARPCDAYTAIDDCSNNPAISHYDISFGGRRTFCREQYFDLDNTIHTTYRAEIPALQSVSTNEDDYGDGSDSFDAMLQKMKEKLQENKK